MEGNRDTFFMRFLDQEAVLDTIPRRVDHEGFTKSLFSGHQLRPQDHRLPVQQNIPDYQSQPWIFAVFVIQLLMLAGIMGYFRMGFFNQLGALVSTKNLIALEKEGNPIYQTHTLLTFLVYVLSSGAAVTVAAGRFWTVDDYSPVIIFLVASALVGGWFLIKVVLFGLLGRASRESINSRRYVMNMAVYNGLAGLLVLPVAIVGAYRNIPYLFTFLVVAVAGLYIIRAVRGVWITQRNSPFPGLYIILYLCTLEIMPVLMALAWVMNA